MIVERKARELFGQSTGGSHIMGHDDRAHHATRPIVDRGRRDIYGHASVIASQEQAICAARALLILDDGFRSWIADRLAGFGVNETKNFADGPIACDGFRKPRESFCGLV
jgi:hypothetical protein